MKKTFLSLFLALGMSLGAWASNTEFAYEVGAEVVSSYLWRGQYNGGLSIQPEALVGFDSKHVSFRIGAWATIGASDWGFRKKGTATDDYNPNTYFVPEVDVMGSLTLFGLTVGFTHYYYCDGTNFFNFGKINDIGGTSQTEVQIGYSLEDLMEVPLYINWYTMVSGDDGYLIDPEDEDAGYKRAYSSYIELGYDQELPLGFNLGIQVGMTPWKSLYTNYEGKFAVNNVSLRLEKVFQIGDFCELSLYGMGSVNTYKIDKDNVFIKGSGDDKLCQQRLNGCIGVGIWF